MRACVRTGLHAHIASMHTCLCVRAHAYMLVCAGVRACQCVHAHIHACTHRSTDRLAIYWIHASHAQPQRSVFACARACAAPRGRFCSGTGDGQRHPGMGIGMDGHRHRHGWAWAWQIIVCCAHTLAMRVSMHMNVARHECLHACSHAEMHMHT